MAEVAGLVLGAIPLILVALDHRQEIHERTQSVFQQEKQTRKLIRYLGWCQTEYEQSIDLLLKDVVSLEKRLQMKRDPQNYVWKQKEFVAKLKERLTKSVYETSMDMIQKIKDIMVLLAVNLDIDGVDEVPQKGLAAILYANPPVSHTAVSQPRFQFWKRFKFFMNYKDIKTQLGLLKDSIERLNGILTNSFLLVDSSQNIEANSGMDVKFAFSLEDISRDASRLHSALHKSWCTLNSCSHQAAILLEQRIARKSQRAGTTFPIEEVDHFSVSLWRPSVSSWLNTEFSLGPRTARAQSGNNIPTTNDVSSRLPLMPTPSQYREITDICKAIKDTTYPYVELFLDASNVLRGVCEVRNRPCRLLERSIQLHDLLPSLKLKCRTFPCQESYRLAITLACSILQLGGTPWLHQSWSKDTVLFLRSNVTEQASVDVQHPYLAMQAHSASTPRDPQLNKLNILNLAIMLLEVATGTLFEDYRQAEYMGSDGTPHNFTDYMAVSKWLSKLKDRGCLSPRYHDAVYACIQLCGSQPASLEDFDFQKAVRKQVIGPLEGEIHLFS